MERTETGDSRWFWERTNSGWAGRPANRTGQSHWKRWGPGELSAFGFGSECAIGCLVKFRDEA